MARIVRKKVEILDGVFPEIAVSTGEQVVFTIRTDTRDSALPALGRVQQNAAIAVRRGDPHFTWNNTLSKRIKPYGPDGQFQFGFDVVDNPVVTTVLVIILAIGLTTSAVGYFAKGSFEAMTVLAKETGGSFKVALGGIGIAIPVLAVAALLFVGGNFLGKASTAKKAFS